MNSIEKEITQHTERVFKATYQNNTCYVKRRIDTKLNRYHQISHFLFRVTRSPLFAVTILAPYRNVCIAEAEKLIQLHQLGINVPRVFTYTDDYLVIEDCGPSLSKIIRAEPEKAQYYLQMAIKALAELHHSGQCHGGAQIRNFTYSNGKVYLIDFEEAIPEKHYDGIVLRDIILFFMSVTAKHITQYSIPDLITIYEQISGITIRNRLFKFANRLRFLNLFTKKPLIKWVGNDVLTMNNFLNNLRNQLKPL